MVLMLILCFKFEASTHAEVAIFSQDQNPLAKITNYMGELTYNSFVSLITILFLTVVSSLYIKQHSLVSRVSLNSQKTIIA